MSRRTAAIVGWGLVGLTGVIGSLTLGLSISAGSPVIPVSSDISSMASPSLVAFALVILVAFAIVGAAVISQRPDNGLGWVFLVGGLLNSVQFLTAVYGYRALAVHPASLPFGRVAAWLQAVMNPPGLGLMTVFLFLLFPDGHLRTRAERRTAAVVIVAIGMGMLGAVVAPTIEGFGNLGSPLQLGVPSTASSSLTAMAILLFLASLVASVVLLVGRLHRAVGRERDQLRVLVWASLVTMVLFAPTLFLSIERYQTLVYAVGGLGLLLIPVSVGVAILRLHLLDIDLVIRRTVVIALIGAFITAVYIGVVVGVGALVGSSGNTALSAVAAAVVAIAFQPVRRWAQRLANRFVYGPRATPYEVLHEFSERVASSYGTEDVLPRMAAILGEGTGADRAQVWLRSDTQLRPAAAWPDHARRTTPVAASDEELPSIPDVTCAVAVRDRGEVLGALSITKGASDPVSATEEKLLSDLALQAGLVMRNVRLVEDLRASRGRLVAAQDQERRRLERNIHDGAQQQLVALAVKAKLADTMIDRDLDKAHEMLAQVQAETQEALESLRDLARGIYPPLLADEGLTAALEAQARKAPMPVTVSADGIGRYAQEVEATAYFCCLEALQNASKYSDASKVGIVLSHLDGALRFTVVDDGRGFDPRTARRGIGLQNMTDRLEAIGGSLEVRSTPGAGTTIVGTIAVLAGHAGRPADVAGD